MTGLNKAWFYSKLATTAVLLSGALFMFAVSAGIAPCNKLLAQSTSCNVGDTQIFTGTTEFQSVIEVGATPVAGSAGEVLVSGGSSAPPEWGSPGVGKSANQTVNNSTVLVNDTELVFAVEADSTYQVTGTLLVNSAAAADWQFQFTVPAGAALDGYLFLNGLSNAVFSESAASAVATNGLLPVTLTFVVVVDSTAGNVQLQWAQNIMNASDTIVQEGSGFIVLKMT